MTVPARQFDPPATAVDFAGLSIGKLVSIKNIRYQINIATSILEMQQCARSSSTTFEDQQAADRSLEAARADLHYSTKLLIDEGGPMLDVVDAFLSGQ